MRSLYLLVLIGICALPFSSLAQFQFQAQNAAIELQPAFPTPNANISAAINAYSYDTTGATITWFVNGTENTTFRDRRTITLTAGALGETTTLHAVLSLRDGKTVTATRSYTPSDVDVVIDAETLVPSFYNGRPLPSIGSVIQVTAIPITHPQQSPSEFDYTWRFEGKVVDGGSVRGGYVGRFPMPLGNGATIVVDVSDDSGKVVAQKNIFVPNHEPELFFYTDNALRGESRISIQKNYELLGSEVTVRAEPYFLDNTIFAQNPHIEWKIDGRTIQNPSDDPQSITLQQTNGSGRFVINFHLRNLRELLQGVEEGFNLIF